MDITFFRIISVHSCIFHDIFWSHSISDSAPMVPSPSTEQTCHTEGTDCRLGNKLKWRGRISLCRTMKALKTWFVLIENQGQLAYPIPCITFGLMRKPNIVTKLQFNGLSVVCAAFHYSKHSTRFPDLKRAVGRLIYYAASGSIETAGGFQGFSNCSSIVVWRIMACFERLSSLETSINRFTKALFILPQLSIDSIAIARDVTPLRNNLSSSWPPTPPAPHFNKQIAHGLVTHSLPQRWITDLSQDLSQGELLFTDCVRLRHFLMMLIVNEVDCQAKCSTKNLRKRNQLLRKSTCGNSRKDWTSKRECSVKLSKLTLWMCWILHTHSQGQLEKCKNINYKKE